MVNDGELTLLFHAHIASETEIKHAAHLENGIQLRDRDGRYVQRVENDSFTDIPFAIIERLCDQIITEERDTV